MGNCDMCGKETTLQLVEIEGTDLNVCSDCSKYGKVKQRPRPQNRQRSLAAARSARSEKEIIQIVKSNFSELVRKKREEMGLKQIELARKLSERESIIQKIESGSYTPSISLARKLERSLNLELVEQQEVTHQQIKIKSDNLTIGDMIKLK